MEQEQQVHRPIFHAKITSILQTLAELRPHPRHSPEVSQCLVLGFGIPAATSVSVQLHLLPRWMFPAKSKANPSPTTLPQPSIGTTEMSKVPTCLAKL